MAQNIEEKLSGLMSIMSRLCTVLQKENALMKQQRTSECAALFEEKEKAAAAYEQAFGFFARHKEILLDLPEKQRAIVKKAAQTVKRLSDENGRLLKANIDATQILLNAIVQDVKEQSKEKQMYTESGDVGRKKNPAAVSFNEVL